MDPNTATSSASSAPRNHLNFCYIYPTGYERLMAVDVHDIKRVRYKGKDFWWIVDVLRYIGFARDLDRKNRSRVLTRPEIDALWLRTLKSRFLGWNYDNLRPTNPGQTVEHFAQCKLSTGLGQRTAPNVEAYWAQKSAAHPGLDISCPPDDTDADHGGNCDYPDGYLSDVPSDLGDWEDGDNDDRMEMEEEFAEMQIAADDDGMDLS